MKKVNFKKAGRNQKNILKQVCHQESNLTIMTNFINKMTINQMIEVIIISTNFKMRIISH
jgi:hypothetical protein